MPEGSYLYCDVSLPVPLDQPFTYALPETLRHRVQPGCRIVVPFGPRKLTGVVLRCHDEPPAVAAREALRLIDAEPVLDDELLALGRWIAGYYCAPLGEVLRGMLPLASEIRRGKIWSLTDAGRDAARQLLLDSVAGRSRARRSCACSRSGRSRPPIWPRAAAGRQGHPLARAQRLHRRRAGADGARPAARALRALARGTAAAGDRRSPSSTSRSASCAPSSNCIPARTT